MRLISSLRFAASALLASWGMPVAWRTVLLVAGCFGTLVTGSFATGSGLQFFVDPSAGDDSNNGTSIETPFFTIERARQAVDAINDNMTGDIVVELRGGVHRLTSKVVFGPGDSGTNGFRVIYRNHGDETAIVSGGSALNDGWTLHDASKNIWKKTGVGGLFRSLTVNGRSAIRARYPNKINNDTFGGFLGITGVSSATKEVIIPQGHIANWSGLQDVEMVMLPRWYNYRGRISSYTVASGQARVTFHPEESTRIFAKGDDWWAAAANPYYFENSIEFLDAEGEWFLDTAGDTLYYKPRTGENPNSWEVEAPALEGLIEVAGTSANDKVRNLTFEGLAFAHTSWNAPSFNGSAMTQGADDLINTRRQGAFYAAYAEGLEIRSCAFRFVGLNAVSFSQGVTSSSIVNSDFRWIAGNGIAVFSNRAADESDKCRNILIANNFITRVGQLHSNGIGIISYYVAGLRVVDNEISYSPYMGTQTGSQSNPSSPEVGMEDNVLRNNYVHDVMQLHDDGGAYYTLARQTGSHIVDNYASNLLISNLTGPYLHALYADNRSEFITFERNAVVNTSDPYFEQVGVINNVWTGNTTSHNTDIFARAGIKPLFTRPLMVEAEGMALAGYATETDSAYVNDSGARCATGTGTASSTFTGDGGSYNFNVTYLAEPGGSASYKVRVNGIQVDAWTALTTPSGTGAQIRHRIVRGVTLASGDLIEVEGTANGTFAARLDYLEIYRLQTRTLPGAPFMPGCAELTASTAGLSWGEASGAASYLIERATSAAGPFTIIANGVTTCNFIDSGLQTGQTYHYRVSATNISGNGPASELAVTPLADPGSLLIQTAADAYVDRGSPTTNLGGSTTVVVKNGGTGLQRKGYLRFNLPAGGITDIQTARLRLVTQVCDARVSWSLYGLKDGDAGESWGETSITWNNAPANVTTSGNGLDGNRVTYLGGIDTGGALPNGSELEISSEALDSFLRADTTGAATLILVRNTASDSANSAIYSREHSVYAAPALEVTELPFRSWNTGGPSDIWNTTHLNWDDTASWSQGDSARFAGPGEAITVEDVTASLLSFSGTGYSLSGGTLTLEEVSTINTSANALVYSVISGFAGLNKKEVGTLTLGGASNYSGPTTIHAGTLKLSGGDNRLPTGGTVSFPASTTLDVGSIRQTLANLDVATNGITGTVLGSGTLTLNGATFAIVPTAASTTRTLNLSGLGAFRYDNSAGTFRVDGITPGINGLFASTGTTNLSPDSIITAANVLVGAGGTNGSAAATSNAGRLNLGASTTLNADTISLGSTRVTGQMGYLAGTSNPALTLRGTSGGVSRVASMTIGNWTWLSSGAGIVDLATNVAGASTLDANITNLVIGDTNRGGSSGIAYLTNGAFTMGAGILDVTTMTVGRITSGSAATVNGSTTSGTFTTGAGGIVKTASLKLGDNNNSSGNTQTLTGTFNLNGGATLQAESIAPGGIGSAVTATRTFNWNSGKIKNYDASTDLIISSGLSTFALLGVGTHAFEIDSGRTGTVNQVISNSGALTKLGAGTLKLAAINTYTGATNVNAGKLSVDGVTAAASAVTVAGTGTLGGTGTIGGATTIQSGGTLAPGNSIGTLSFDSTVDLQVGSTYAAEIASGGNDKITATTFTANGTIKVTLTGGYSPATGTTFDLADANTLAGTPAFDFTAAVLDPGLSWDTTSYATDGTIKVTGTATGTVFDTWATANGVTGGKGGDDDKDGISNLLEFATAANPQSGASGARVYPLAQTLGGQKVLTYTVAVRGGATFASNGAKQQADRDGIRYVVEASDDLATWDTVVVSELAPADANVVQAALGTQLNGLDAAWQWHSFRTDGDTATDPNDFIRLNVSDVP